MSREQTQDAAVISGLLKKVSLDQLIELYNKTDKTLSHYNGKGFTVFLAAVRVNNYEFIAYLFKQSPARIKEWVSQFTQSGQSALHILAEKSANEDGASLATLLLNNGASVDATTKDEKQLTPLYLATMYRNTRLASVFINHNANINFTSQIPNDISPITLSCVNKENVVENASQAKLREAFLIAACKNNDISAVAALLAAGTNTNIKDPETGFTPLHIAAGLKNLRCVELLLGSSIKPDVNSVDNDGGTPLVVAMTRTPHDDETVMAIIRTLIKHGANILQKVKVKNKDVVCLEFMAEYCKRDAFDFIDVKTIKEYRSEKGLTLLHLAVNANNLGTHNASGPIGLFKDILGIDIRSANNGPTALEVVTANGTASCAQLLLYYKANPLSEAPGKKGVNAYAFAKSTDNDNPERLEILKLIEEELGIKHEKENTSRSAKPTVPNNLHTRLPTAPACKAVGKTPTLYQPLPKANNDEIYVSSRLRSGQPAAAATSLPGDAYTETSSGPITFQRPK